jgi:hypothetical protein
MSISSPGERERHSSKAGFALYTDRMRRTIAGLTAALTLVACATDGVTPTGGGAPVQVNAVAIESGTVGTGAVLATEAAAVVAAGAANAANIVIGPAGLWASVWLAGAAPSVLFGMVFAAVFVSEGLGYEPPAAMDPTRAVNEQDCTKPIDITKGNLKCVRSGAK